jgi:hypothetical protein
MLFVKTTIPVAMQETAPATRAEKTAETQKFIP